MYRNISIGNIGKVFYESDDDLDSISYNTLASYINCCEDAFLIEKAEQYNVKEENTSTQTASIISLMSD
jgi:predicted AAA+ superfamily ATPase